MVACHNTTNTRPSISDYTEVRIPYHHRNWSLEECTPLGFISCNRCLKFNLDYTESSSIYYNFLVNTGFRSKIYSNKVCVMSCCIHLLQVIDQRAEPLRRANQVLIKELQPLDTWTVRHEAVELIGVGRVEFRQGRVSGGRIDVLADAPHARVGRVLVLVAQEEVVQELGALRVWGVLEDGAALAPGDEEAVLGDGYVVGRRGGHADAAAEGCGVCAVGLADEGDGSGGAADPARSLGEELLEPVEAILSNAVVRWLVFLSWISSHMLRTNSRQVECKKHGVIIVRIREDQFVLEFRLQKVGVLHRTIYQLVCIPNIAPAKDNDGVPRPPGIAKLRVDLVEVQRLVT